MNKKKWDSYVKYLGKYYEKTDWVLRDSPYVEFHQFPEDRQDLRDEIDQRLRLEFIYEVLATLTDRERRIIILRFGLDDGVPKTLETVSELFNVTRNRIRQLECKALRKLRHPIRRKGLLPPCEYQEMLEKEKKEQAEYEKEMAIKEEAKKKARAEWWERQGKREHDEREGRRILEEIQREERYQERIRRAQELSKDKELELMNQRVAANLADQNNDTRPYLWDSLNKRRKYLNEQGIYE